MTIISIEVEIEIFRKQLVVEFDLECDGSYMNMYYTKSEAPTAEKRETTLKSHISFRYCIPNSHWSENKKWEKQPEDPVCHAVGV